MDPRPDRRTRNAERFARLREHVERLERLAAVTGQSLEVRVTEAGGVTAFLSAPGRRPNPPCRNRPGRG